MLAPIAELSRDDGDRAKTSRALPVSRPMVNLATFDLNLLRIFDAIMEDRSVVRAGRRLGLSQSAVSHALNRLRYFLKDELFVRTAAGMQPTERATELSAPLRQALLQIAAALGSPAFEPATARRRFVLAANDYVTAVLLPKLISLLARVAPNVDLVVRPSTRLDLAEQIDMGRIDVALGVFASVPSRFRAHPILKQDEVLVMRKGHAASQRRLSLRELSQYSLVAVTLGGLEEGAVSGFIMERGLARQSEMFDRTALERAMEKEKMTPRISMMLPHFLAVPRLLAESDLLAIVPRPLAHVFETSGAVATQELPYPTTPIAVQAVWHARNDDDPAQKWLRDAIVEIGISACVDSACDTALVPA